jgi:hypothetical protein
MQTLLDDLMLTATTLSATDAALSSSVTSKMDSIGRGCKGAALLPESVDREVSGWASERPQGAQPEASRVVG